MASIENILENLKSISTGKMTAMFSIIVVSIASMLLLYSWIQKADYQVLYSNLSEADTGRIVEELRTKKVSYKIEPGGAVLVPGDRVYDLRLELASQGLPQGAGVGFEIFDATNFTTSEFVQKLNFKRALEGELTRTIQSLSGVQQGRVHLVIPDKSIFAFQESRPEATAAVFVTLEKGRKLSASEVEGIVHLVSSSVEDLSPENITVIDNRGQLLTKPSSESSMSLSGTQMEYQHNYEQNVMAKIVSILEPVVGKGRVKSKVSTQFDFTKSERTEEVYDPDGVVVRSEQKTTEKSTSGMSGGRGIPGAASNLPGGAAAGSASSGSQSQKQDEMVNYETSKTVRHVVESPVTLERMTVAIIIDGILPSQKASVENADKYIARTEEDIKQYEDIIRKSIGFTEDRGDEITVTVMPFEQIEYDNLPEVKRDYMAIVMTVLKYLVPLVVAVLFFMMVLRPMVKSLTAASPSRRVPVSARSEGAPQIEELHTQEIPLERQVIEWASKNPQQAAGLVKGWMEE